MRQENATASPYEDVCVCVFVWMHNVTTQLFPSAVL